MKNISTKSFSKQAQSAQQDMDAKVILSLLEDMLPHNEVADLVSSPRKMFQKYLELGGDPEKLSQRIRDSIAR